MKEEKSVAFCFVAESHGLLFCVKRKNMKTIVISAVNLVEGGAYTILRECLLALSKLNIENRYKIVALVNNHTDLNFENIEFVDFPKAKKNWVYRIYYEYCGFKKLSKQLKPYLWLSLHDITPNVLATVRAVYCHNPTPFYKAKKSDFRHSYKLVLFSFFYKYLYRINIKKNNFVIVQQKWIKEAFVHNYDLHGEQVLVAYPNTKTAVVEVGSSTISDNKKSKKTFFYPSLSRTFKNFEFVCEAVKVLNAQAVEGFEVLLTLDGMEDSYASWVVNKYKDVDNIKFIGLIPYSKMADCYRKTDCLIFPSRLETWGLPISEFAQYDKPMLLIDLPYAHETSIGAKYVDYFNAESCRDLAQKMENVIKGDLSQFKMQERNNIDGVFVENFAELFSVLLKETSKNN